MSNAERNALARKRASVILRVRSGHITASQGAKELGISRKSYYAWEKKALAALLQTLEDQPAGRPAAQIDVEQERRKEQIRSLEQENGILRARVEVQGLLLRMDKDGNKKNTFRKSRRNPEPYAKPQQKTQHQLSETLRRTSVGVCKHHALVAAQAGRTAAC